MSPQSALLHKKEGLPHWYVLRPLSLSPHSFSCIWRRPCWCYPVCEVWCVTDPPCLDSLILRHLLSSPGQILDYSGAGLSYSPPLWYPVCCSHMWLWVFMLLHFVSSFAFLDV
jgi:hypothetical protein